MNIEGSPNVIFYHIFLICISLYYRNCHLCFQNVNHQQCFILRQSPPLQFSDLQNNQL